MADNPDSGKPRQKMVMDLINRGTKKSNLAGTLSFVGLRAIDPLFQYKLLTSWGPSLLSRLGLSVVIEGVYRHWIPYLDTLGLPTTHLILLCMAVGSTAKQVYWLVSLSAEEFPTHAAVAVSFYNTLVNSINSLLLLSSATSVASSPKFPGTSLPYQVVMGSALYAVGMLLETASEHQRKVFKENPQNKGKVMKSGLWSWARHINYGGYAMWRAGYCMAASGWLGGLVFGLWQSADFALRAVPVLEDYCEKRYGGQWQRFKEQVKWIIFPGIY